MKKSDRNEHSGRVKTNLKNSSVMGVVENGETK